MYVYIYTYIQIYIYIYTYIYICIRSVCLGPNPNPASSHILKMIRHVAMMFLASLPGTIADPTPPLPLLAIDFPCEYENNP